MDLDLWAELNLVGNVSFGDYCKMEHEEAKACLQALNRVISAAKEQQERERRFNDHLRKYEK